MALRFEWDVRAIAGSEDIDEDGHWIAKEWKFLTKPRI